MTARVANARDRRAASGRLTLTLRPSSGAKQPLEGFNVKRLKGGNVRTLRMKVLVGSKVRAGTYSLAACVRRGSGEDKASCKTVGRIAITSPPTATPVPTAAPAPATDTRTISERLRSAITADGMLSHLRAFQGIADANGGNRASGLQGYGGTTQYLLTTLRAAGYQPTVQTFSFPFFRQLDDSVFERTAPTPKTYVEGTSFFTMSYSGSGDTTALVRPVDIITAPGNRANTSGCEAGDFAGFPAGRIALMQRGSCNFGVKVANAEDAGASGAIIFNQGDNPTPARSAVFGGTLGAPVGIPAVSISFADGVELSTGVTPTAHIKTQTQNDDRTTSNIIAETPGGDASKVVVVGSHLDSVPEGPGINDNGTGSAFNLELAVQMAKLNLTPANKVRFAWWGAEEEGLLGSTYYVAQLSDAAFENIQLNLNFDMLGSPNHAKFVYDGNFSDTPPPATAPNVNPGAAEIEQVFIDYFTSVGLQSEPSGFDGRSDYKAFQDNGVPAGGLFSGAEVSKTPAQASKWGGLPNVAFDPNYHQAGDTINNIDAVAYEQMADAGAHVTGVYASRTLNAGGGAAAAKARSARSTSTLRRQAEQSEYLGSHLQR